MGIKIVSDFEKAFNNYKAQIGLELVQGKESSRVPAILERVDLNRELANYFFDSQQAIIDDQKNQLKNIKKRIDEVSQALIDKADRDASSDPYMYETKRAYFQGISEGLNTFRHSIGLSDDLDKEMEGEHAE